MKKIKQKCGDVLCVIVNIILHEISGEPDSADKRTLMRRS